MSLHYNAEKFIATLYRRVLEREPDPSSLKKWAAAASSGELEPHVIVQAFFDSDERERLQKASSPAEDFRITDSYHAPMALSVSLAKPKRIILTGTCLVLSWKAELERQTQVDYLQVNHVTPLPEAPPHPASEYGFHIVNLSFRSIIAEQSFFSIPYNDVAAFEQAFDVACGRMIRLLEESMRWNERHGILTLVCNHMTPQQNMLGRTMPRYDLRNLVYFIEKLNERLAQAVSKYKNAYVLDLDRLTALYGKRFFQDDLLTTAMHQALLCDYDAEHDRDRITKVAPATAQYEARPQEFVRAVWEDALAIYRTVQQQDQVKLVIMDLDDSLWRGVAAEGAFEQYQTAVFEGWPAGVMEALMTLKQRGVLLAIASKNNETRVGELWKVMTGNRIRMEDFAARRINWQPKAQNIAEILSEVNLLSKNVLFIDDNPVERAAVKQAFPDMRVMGENPYLVKRTLLWAAETQVATITDESARRTEMIQAQVKRESDRKALSREDFLGALNIKLKFHVIRSVDDGKFARAFELINKTNQFNTTGERWTHATAMALFNQQGSFWSFEVEDTHSDYGLVGVVVVRGTQIDQWAMSCRVLGLDVEIAALAEITKRMASSGETEATARIVETDANFLCRDLFLRGGFSFVDDVWRKRISTSDSIEVRHVEVLPS